LEVVYPRRSVKTQSIPSRQDSNRTVSIGNYFRIIEKLLDKMKEEITQLIDRELQRSERSIRNRSAIDHLLKLFPGTYALKEVLTGSKKALDLERQKLTTEKILDLLVGIDAKLSGEDLSGMDEGLKILIERVVAEGDIIGLEGKTSDEAVRKIFEKPVDVKIKDVSTKGKITGVKLGIDEEMEVKERVEIETDNVKVKIDPKVAKITFGKGFKK